MKKTTLFLLFTAFTFFSYAQQITLIDFGLSSQTTAGNWNNVFDSGTLDSFIDLIDNLKAVDASYYYSDFELQAL